MAFIGVFLLAILFIVFFFASIIALIGLIIGIILNIIFTKKKNEGKRYGKIWAIISRVQIIICSICLVPLTILVIVLGIYRTQIPKEFVKTDNIIYSYNDLEINSSNGKYVPIYLNTTKSIGYFEKDDIIYSYMPDGLFEKYKWKNHYTIKNNTGYEIIALDDSYDYQLYCKEENLDSILEYYNNNKKWFYNDNKLEEKDQLILNDYENHITFNQYVSDFKAYFYEFELNSDDNIFKNNTLHFTYYENEIHLYVNEFDYLFNDNYKEYILDETLTNLIIKYIENE